MARGIAFINETSATVWMWSNTESNEYVESTYEIMDDGHMENEDGDVLDVNIAMYEAVVDGEAPTSSPIGKGVIGGSTYTLWVRTDKKSGQIIDWSHITIAPSVQKNGLLGRVK